LDATLRPFPENGRALPAEVARYGFSPVVKPGCQVVAAGRNPITIPRIRQTLTDFLKRAGKEAALL
jgi:hypothetical protein